MKVYINCCMLGWTNLIFGKILVPEIWAKMLLANEIAEFLNQIYLQNKIMKNVGLGVVLNSGYRTKKSAVSHKEILMK